VVEEETLLSVGLANASQFKYHKQQLELQMQNAETMTTKTSKENNMQCNPIKEANNLVGILSFHGN